MSRERGFGPLFDENSKVLVLGSFPSVRSRAQGFYYGNPQNRFWSTLSAFFGEDLPRTVEEKRSLCLRHGVALWDIVTECDITGSADDSIRGEHVADLNVILKHAPVKAILCNGAKSYSLLERSAPERLAIALKLPSTSPANPRFSKEVWFEALRAALG